jgi:hypothetical protein
MRNSGEQIDEPARGLLEAWVAIGRGLGEEEAKEIGDGSG